MDSDFFTEGYEDRKKIAVLESRIAELTHEINGGEYFGAGRSKKHLEEEVAALMKEKIEILSRLSHEEDQAK